MAKLKINSFDLNRKSAAVISPLRLLFIVGLVTALGALAFPPRPLVSAQTPAVTQPPTDFRISERLTYNFSFEKFNNVAYAETYVVSRGTLGGKDAVELRGKFNTVDLVSAAFYMVDEVRTTFAAAGTGLPLYVRQRSLLTGLANELISNYLTVPIPNYDLLTLIYRARQAGGSGNFPLQEADKVYNVAFLPVGAEQVKTDISEFDTVLSTVQSDFFTERGISDVRVNFSADEQKLPVLIRFRTEKGEFRGGIASIQVIEPEIVAVLVPTPRPLPTATPTPLPTPTPYVENRPLLPELPFRLGETLTYQVAQNAQPIAALQFRAKERKLFAGEDSLTLQASVIGLNPGNQIFNLTDSITARVNPESLAPQQIELKFNGFLSRYNQETLFDQRAGTAVFNSGKRLEIPVGTHSIVSLAYAIRSFNLKPSKDPNNPVNDTRVAVLLGDAPQVFTLRPSNAEIINLQGEKVSAQQISITTGAPAVDQYNLRVWLSNDEARTPLRVAFGNYQADLVSITQNLPQ